MTNSLYCIKCILTLMRIKSPVVVFVEALCDHKVLVADITVTIEVVTYVRETCLLALLFQLCFVLSRI